MKTIVSVAELRRAGITIEAEEAVAIAQQLMAALRTGVDVDVVQPPYGPPTSENVYLDEDGSVICRACETTPAVSEMAIFLQAMLPVPSIRLPGGLRYTIARALLDVDVPPFDSLGDFSETLARYERGSRRQIVRRVLQRLHSRRSLVPVYAGDRRRHPQATPLRRALREADARLYLQMQTLASEAVTAPVIPHPAPPRDLHGAACIAAGLLLIITGEFIDGGHRPAPPPPLAATTAARAIALDVALVPDEPRTLNAEPQTLNPEPRTLNPEPRTLNPEPRTLNPEPRTLNPEPRTLNPETRTLNPEPRTLNPEPRTLNPDTRTLNPEPRTPNPDLRRPRPSTKRVSRIVPPQTARDRARRAPASERGVLDRLRLNWLRTVFTSS